MNLKQALNIITSKNKFLILLSCVVVAISIAMFYTQKNEIRIQNEKIGGLKQRADELKLLENLHNQIKLKKDKIKGLKKFKDNSFINKDENFPVLVINEIAKLSKMSLEWIEQVPDKTCSMDDRCMVVSVSLTGKLSDFHTFLLNLLSLSETDQLRLVQIQAGSGQKDFLVHVKMSQKIMDSLAIKH